MKKIFLLNFILFSLNVYSQNIYNVLVQANNIRVWSKPFVGEVIPDIYLTLGEKVRLISVIIEDRAIYGYPGTFVRIYRNGANNKPYYLNLSEANIDLRNLKILPKEDAVIDEKFIPKLWLPKHNILLNVEEILFFDGENLEGVYFFLNKAALSRSIKANSKLSGFYKIKNIINCKVKNKDNIIFECKPLNTPFNQTKNDIYVEYLTGSDNIDFQSLSFTNYFSNLITRYAYEYPNVKETPYKFYGDYLSSLYGKVAYSFIDEFEKKKLIDISKTFIDSIFNERDRVFAIPSSDVYYSILSDYDFNDKTFNLLTFSDGDKIAEEVKILDGFKSWPETDIPFYNFINLTLFNTKLEMNIDSAEMFTKEIKKNIFDDFDIRKVVLIPYYKYISEERARSFINKYGITEAYLKNSKLIDSIEVYSGKIFNFKETLDKPFQYFEKSETKKWATLYPKQ